MVQNRVIKKFNQDDIRKQKFTMIGWIPEIVDMLDDDHSFEGTRVTMGGDVRLNNVMWINLITWTSGGKVGL